MASPSTTEAVAGLPRVFPTVVHLLDAAAEQWPEREALVAGSIRLSFAQYRSAVARFAARLVALGMRGERIAILLPNGADICVATWGVHAAGAVVVPLNPLYTARELEAILADAAPGAIVYAAGKRDLVDPIVARLGIGLTIALDADGALVDGADASTPLPTPLPDPDDLAFVQYTGGTTGRSKGVLLRHRATSVNVSQREGLLPVDTRGERILCVMPLFHTYALAMGLHLAAYAGATLVVLPRYHPQEVLAALAAERITIFPGSPTIYTGLMGHPDFATTDFSRLHTCYSGSAALPVETLRRWESALGCKVYEGFGQTEAGPVLAFNPLVGVQKPGSCGVVVPGTELQIVDVETGTRVLAAGELGEIRARGPQVMDGYRNLPDETAATLRDGWLLTGDIGEIDADGYLFIRDRKKDMVIVGGYNVYPREVEDVLHLHPAVREAAVVGAPDAYRGEVVKAYVVVDPAGGATVEALVAHCTASLAKYKVPSTLEIVTALPRTGVGKTDKVALRRIARGE
jgi:long-chain acyl-CoA synthetase